MKILFFQNYLFLGYLWRWSADIPPENYLQKSWIVLQKHLRGCLVSFAFMSGCDVSPVSWDVDCG